MHELAVHVVWDGECALGSGAHTCHDATAAAQRLLATLATPAALDASTRPLADTAAAECTPCEGDWEELLGRCLSQLNDVTGDAASEVEGSAESIPKSAIRVRPHPRNCRPSTHPARAARKIPRPRASRRMPQYGLQEFLDGPGLSTDLDSLLALSAPQPDAAAAAASRALSKVVLARRAAVRLRGSLDALALLALLQSADPSSYQAALVLPSGAAFVSSTPERLFMRHGRTVTTEAIAGALLATLFPSCMARRRHACVPSFCSVL